MFWETSGENEVLYRFENAILQMRAGGVIECVDAANETGFGSIWTYLGQQCCLKLGATVANEPISFELTPQCCCPLSTRSTRLR